MTLGIILYITTITTALMSGFFYAYTCSVMPGLGRLKDEEFVRAMQSINIAVLNPIFFINFIGNLIMLPLSTWVTYKIEGSSTNFLLLLAASISYVLGVFLVTGLGNVPLNKMLRELGTDISSVSELAKHRRKFEVQWNRLNHIRSFCILISLIFILLVQNKFW